MVYQRYHLMYPPGNEEAPTQDCLPIVTNKPPAFYSCLMSRTLEHKAIRRYFPAERYRDGFLIGVDVSEMSFDYRPLPLAFEIVHRPHILFSKAELKLYWLGVQARWKDLQEYRKLKKAARKRLNAYVKRGKHGPTSTPKTRA